MENLKTAIAHTTILMRSLHDSDEAAALVCIEILELLEKLKPLVILGEEALWARSEDTPDNA